MSALSRRLVEYVEGLSITQGDGAGEPFPLLPWQRRFLHGAWGQDGSAALSIARGNGKTTLVAALGAAAVDGPLAKPRAEAVIVASSFEQGRIAFDHALAFLRSRGHDLEDRRKWRVNDTAMKAAVEYKPTGSRIRCIGSDPQRAHGLAPVLAILDEGGVWPHTSSGRMYSAIRTSLGKIPGAKLVALGTMPADEEHWFRALLNNPLAYGQVHAATSEDRAKRPYRLATIRKANPSWEYLPTLRHTVLREREEARADPALAAQFRALRLNGGVSDVMAAELIDAEAWGRIEAAGEARRSGPYVLGVDLGGGAAMSAVAGYWPMTGRLEARAAFPSLPPLDERERADGVDGLYRRMVGRGELWLSGEHAVDLPAFLCGVVTDWGAPACVTADRWKEKDLAQALQAARVPRCPWIPRGQGFRDGGQDVSAFRRACLEGRVRPVVSLLLRAAMREARTVADPARNEKLAKASEGGRRVKARDDAAAASIVAVAEGYREAMRKGWGVPA